MTRWQTRAAWVRWAMLIVGVLLFAGALVFILGAYWEWTPGLVFSPLSPWLGTTDNDASAYWLYACDVAMWVGGFLLMQWCFLRPSRLWRVRVREQSRPMRTSVIAAACVAMLISAGAIATLMELPQWWGRWFYDMPDGKNLRLWPVWIAMGVLWVVWGVIFYLYWRRGDRYTQLSRMTRGLFAGSVLQVFISTAIYVWNPRNEDCWCSRGSYSGLIFGGTALIWCFGPGVVLLFMRERYRASAMHCPNCDYDLRGTIAAGKTMCPECGEALAKL